jgi:orotidine 5'-phosphate decarboxylase subfamily 1
VFSILFQSTIQAMKQRRRTYAERRQLLLENRSPLILSTLYDIMEKKQSNLCVAADVTTTAELLQLIHQVGPLICVLKTHIDILADFTPELIQELTRLAQVYEFLLFEDRKFADIGNTTTMQYRDGIYRISEWAHLVNCHVLPGPGILAALCQVCAERKQELNQDDRGIIIISDMSSEGWLGDDTYKQMALSMGHHYTHCVAGWISQNRWDPNMPGVIMTPGISLNNKWDNLGQQYTTPTEAIAQNGSDIIIVGRGIVKAINPATAAELYRQAGWEAYLTSIGSAVSKY